MPKPAYCLTMPAAQLPHIGCCWAAEMLSLRISTWMLLWGMLDRRCMKPRTWHHHLCTQGFSANSLKMMAGHEQRDMHLRVWAKGYTFDKVIGSPTRNVRLPTCCPWKWRPVFVMQYCHQPRLGWLNLARPHQHYQASQRNVWLSLCRLRVTLRHDPVMRNALPNLSGLHGYVQHQSCQRGGIHNFSGIDSLQSKLVSCAVKLPQDSPQAPAWSSEWRWRTRPAMLVSESAGRGGSLSVGFKSSCSRAMSTGWVGDAGCVLPDGLEGLHHKVTKNMNVVLVKPVRICRQRFSICSKQQLHGPWCAHNSSWWPP